MTRHCWEEMPREDVADGITRRFINGDRMMLTHIYLRKGAVVARHFHPNEQFTYVLEGALRFWIGEEGAEVFDVRGGEVLHIPSNVQHRVEALEDTIDIDVFSPPRQDWLDGTDDYFRRQ
ncbi:MAG TPA: cupin domain-containing protein [Thermoanaerobaculia bacterium]|nr:cupin domain-containing protein [Thermoanaerobaculia bacterium]